MPYVKMSRSGKYRGASYSDGDIISVSDDLANRIIINGQGSKSSTEDFEKKKTIDKDILDLEKKKTIDKDILDLENKKVEKKKLEDEKSSDEKTSTQKKTVKKKEEK